MSTLIHPLNNFIAIVPSCVHTSNLGVVLDIFSQEQCDRLVIVNEQQHPLGVLNLSRLMPQVMNLVSGGDFDLQQPLSRLILPLIEPIATLSATDSIEQFSLQLRSQPQINSNSNWALLDETGKFLGLLDISRLGQFLAVNSLTPLHQQELEASINEYVFEAVVSLLDQLPLPLTLQASSGAIVRQNQAWKQNFAAVSDPKVIATEVTAILEQRIESEKSMILLPLPTQTPAFGFPRCQLDSQPNTCICVLPGDNQQEERVWQFIKIPLLSSPEDLKLSVSPGDTNLWLLLATDVTAQQQMASELAAKNADLIQLNRLKDEFLACISHELKTPLTAVLGLSTLLKDRTLGSLNERQARYAGLIHESGRHLMTVVNDILDLTRMETGQLHLSLEPVQIKTVCDRAIEQAKTIQPKTNESTLFGTPALNHSGNHLTVVIEPGLNLLLADELRLRQMLVNLLANAFKFTPPEGEIGLQVNRWEGWIAFTVWDTGIGIPEHQQHLIFQKFQQLENPLNRRFEGTGLGLVLTRALARLHGGDVSFFSKEGKGSSFTLLLPPSPPHQVKNEAEEFDNPLPERLGAWAQGGQLPLTPRGNSDLAQQQSRLVLVVETASRLIEDLTEHLSNLGYQFIIARSGTEALDKARRLQPGVVLLNPLLPLLSGWDVLTLLKSDPLTRQIPVIITATRAEKERAFSNRADEFLSLPIQQQALQQVLAHFCSSLLADETGTNAKNAASEILMTILRLSQEVGETASSLWLLNSESLHQHHYRVLEADDLEQADMIARVWQPDVILLDRGILDPLAYLAQLSQYPSLINLPVVTLDAATTRAANQVPGLSVFPCLMPPEKLNTDALLPVLQIAAHKTWKPNIVVVDLATLSDLPEVGWSQINTPLASASVCSRPEWCQALIQYFHTAGFAGVIAQCWTQVLQLIQQQSVDLLLICVPELKLQPKEVAALSVLSQQPNLPPVLLLARQLSQSKDNKEQFYSCLELEGNAQWQTESTISLKSNPVESVESVWSAIAPQILPASISMAELLDRIQQTLAHSSQ